MELYCVNDNAANQKLGVKLTPDLLQHLCENHTMELAVGDTFKNVDGMSNVLKKTKALAKLTHDSCKALEELKKEAKKEKVPFRKLKNPPNTRWSGRLDNLKSVLHLKTPIKTLCEVKEKWEDLELTKNEWKQVEGAVKVLEPVKAFIKELEAEKEPTMHKTIAELYKIHHVLKTFIDNKNNCGFGIGFARELKKQIESRFPNKGAESMERRQANYLAPQFRGAHLDPVNMLEVTRTEIKAKVELETGEAETDNAELEEANDVQLSPTSKLVKQHQAKMKRSKNINTKQTKIEIEMERYEGFSNPGRNVDVLQWWKARQTVLPLLANQAKRVLAIPATSSKSERVFSTGGNFVTAKRNRLAPKKVEHLIVIKENKEKVEEFNKKGGYAVTQNTAKPFKEITEEFKAIENDDGIFGADHDDLEEEEIIVINDFDGEEESEEEEEEEEIDLDCALMENV